MLTSCASIQSVSSDGSGNTTGLVYFLPMKKFTLSVVVKKGDIVSVTPGVSASFPDVNNRFVLNHRANFLGKNTASVSVTDQGLLSSANSTTISGVSEALINLSSSIGIRRGLSFSEESSSSECDIDSTYLFVIDKGDDRTPCGVTVEIEKLSSGIERPLLAASATERRSGTGVYYRVNEPYIIRAVAPNGLKTESIVFSPIDSDTFFLPVTKTFFASNKAELSFKDGVPNKYVQETDGELVALFKLPADIISAYFAAAGSVFDSFKSSDSKEAAALAESLKLEIAKDKYIACLEALNNEDGDATFKELGCP